MPELADRQAATDPPQTEREAAVQHYPLTPSERFAVLAARSADDLTWVREKYGQAIGSLLSCEIFGVLHHDEHIRQAQLYTRDGIQALHISDMDICLPRDVQTGYMLANGEPHAIESVLGLRQNIQRGVNGIQIHRSGVTGIEANPATVFLPSALQIDHVMRTYMTSIPQLSPEQGETEAQMQQRLGRERKHAFALFKDIMEAEQLQGLHVTDLNNILEVCFRLCNGQQPSFVLTTGFGGSEDQPSTRMPSYIAGACEIMELFLRHQSAGQIRHMPKFRILNAYKIAGLVNQMDDERTRASAQDMQNILREFLERFMPDVADHVYFEMDEGIAYPTLEETRQYFARLPADHPSHKKIASQAERMMQKERLQCRDDAVFRVQQYIAAHLSIFLDVVTQEWHEGTSYYKQKPDIVWSMGGKGEYFFNEFRRMFSEGSNGSAQFHSSYHPISIRTLQKPGQHPPYYHLANVDTSIYQLNGEPIMPDAKKIKDKAISKSVSTDYKALLGMVKRSMAKKLSVPVETIEDDTADATLKSFFLSIGKSVERRQITA